MKQLWQSATLMFFTADSVLLLLSGRAWVRFTRFGSPDGLYFKTMTWFLQWPEWLLRALGAVEGLLALSLFRRWQRPEQGGIDR